MCIISIWSITLYALVMFSTVGIKPTKASACVYCTMHGHHQRFRKVSPGQNRLGHSSTPAHAWRLVITGTRMQRACVHANVYISISIVYIWRWKLLTQTNSLTSRLRRSLLAAKLHQGRLAPLLVRYGARRLPPPPNRAGDYLETQLCCG